MNLSEKRYYRITIGIIWTYLKFLLFGLASIVLTWMHTHNRPCYCVNVALPQKNLGIRFIKILKTQNEAPLAWKWVAQWKECKPSFRMVQCKSSQDKCSRFTASWSVKIVQIIIFWLILLFLGNGREMYFPKTRIFMQFVQLWIINDQIEDKQSFVMVGCKSSLDKRLQYGSLKLKRCDILMVNLLFLKVLEQMRRILYYSLLF